MDDGNNVIRSLLSKAGKGQTSKSTNTNIPSLDLLSQLDPAIIQQVRQEYITTQQWSNNSNNTLSLDQLLDSMVQVTSITPELISLLDRMKKETTVLETIAVCQRAQNEKERQLSKQRNLLLEKHKNQLDTILAKQMIGAKNADEKYEFEERSKIELGQMDRHILRELDKETQALQLALKKHKVPLFYVTKDPTILSLQKEIISLLLQ
ncbi:uncharacterized protein BX664DRAFT_319601 [Halteromyces radiatus]|uniref:uncharacterized protein n=1 Tax=Halteromyces radiatus TaxID=101107 RepID=UPI00221EE94A|nr:uncharacterized protein BX664DRAFT_319601 [Halteromyces radiatus]KAI8098792.1 hypothetical protein BX664DRAFT_319601 [Halteromyces radiatus]